MSNKSKAWFAPKRYGFGAGLPIAWQGWAVLAVYTVVCCGSPLVLLPLLPPDAATIGIVAIVVIATIAVIVVSAMTTKGGWKWRWGRDE